VEIRAVTLQYEHEQKFGIQARRGDVGRSEARDGGSEAFAERHKII
jgi:hypothetical protein